MRLGIVVPVSVPWMQPPWYLDPGERAHSMGQKEWARQTSEMKNAFPPVHGVRDKRFQSWVPDTAQTTPGIEARTCLGKPVPGHNATAALSGTAGTALTQLREIEVPAWGGGRGQCTLYGAETGTGGEQASSQ